MATKLISRFVAAPHPAAGAAHPGPSLRRRLRQEPRYLRHLLLRSLLSTRPSPTSVRRNAPAPCPSTPASPSFTYILLGEGGSNQSMAPLPWRQRHHTLLQALLSRGPLAEPDFHAVFAAVSDRDPATHQQLFNDTLPKIKKDLTYLQFELRACINQYDGMVYYGVVNNVADEGSKLEQSILCPRLHSTRDWYLEAVVQEAGNDGSITSIDALVRLDNQVIIVDGSQDSQTHLPTSIKNFTMSQKEKTLDELTRDRWLSYTSTGKIGLGIRSFLDLRSWFRGNDIPSCVVCNDACIKVLTRDDSMIFISCLALVLNLPDNLLMFHALLIYLHMQASRDCPSCGTEWPCQDGEADGADDVNEPVENQVVSANHSSKKRRRRVKAELVEDNDNAGPSTAVPRRTSRSAKAEAVEAAQEASSAGTLQATRTSKRRK
ncbi:hypothetical protein BAE44_0015360 [Dichanthelium oligosanthes]|uniref:Non-structural maintenance of chromosomes element 1 homolog n=1 Tax=Dichanthelium oligosanthes TaxID=888268 RepID=A0A1E5VEQ9_9POAL|nr:hypothetical protein BAE44_0015360 [Dichanthelium oligosanthes]